MAEFRGLSGNSVRSLTRANQLSRSLSSSDDTFGTAKLIGELRASRSPMSFQAKGVVAKSDKVDVFKLKLLPGVEFPSTTYITTVVGGKLRFEVYLQHPDITNGRIIFQDRGTLKGSSVFNFGRSFNETSETATVYLKVFTKDKNVKYNINLRYNPL